MINTHNLLSPVFLNFTIDVMTILMNIYVQRILTTESPLKMMKNAFYFTTKALSFLKIFKLCLDF